MPEGVDTGQLMASLGLENSQYLAGMQESQTAAQQFAAQTTAALDQVNIQYDALVASGATLQEVLAGTLGTFGDTAQVAALYAAAVERASGAQQSMVDSGAMVEQSLISGSICVGQSASVR